MRNEKLEGVYEGLKLALKIIRTIGKEYDAIGLIEAHMALLNDYKPINNVKQES